MGQCLVGGAARRTQKTDLSSLSVSAHEADDELLHHSENDDAHSVLITTNNRQRDLLLCTHSCRVC